jgi:hypothetical protein
MKEPTPQSLSLYSFSQYGTNCTYKVENSTLKLHFLTAELFIAYTNIAVRINAQRIMAVAAETLGTLIPVLQKLHD